MAWAVGGEGENHQSVPLFWQSWELVEMKTEKSLTHGTLGALWHRKTI